MFIDKISLKSKPNDYTAYLPAVKHLSEHPLKISSPITFFVGENGTGKSTLLEAIAVAIGFNAEGGSRNYHFSTKTTHSDLYRHLTVARNAQMKDGYFLRAESFYNTASYLDEVEKEDGSRFASYGGRSLHLQSHGESFLALIQNRFSGSGLYLLDEPEAALSPMRQMTLMIELDRLKKTGSQFIIATHSPMLITLPGCEVLEFTENGIQSVPYQKTEHFQVMKSFLSDPNRMLGYLLDEE
ncbi:MAG: AAA family ATPase [Clostridia bacterium]|nr:AAA family ATPase [Clostridia bacterium]